LIADCRREPSLPKKTGSVVSPIDGGTAPALVGRSRAALPRHARSGSFVSPFADGSATHPYQKIFDLDKMAFCAKTARTTQTENLEKET